MDSVKELINKVVSLKTIDRDMLGFPIKFNVYDPCGNRVNIINKECTTICIGDQYRHSEFGVGMITWISSNQESKFPIQVHFKERGCYIKCNVHGKTFQEQNFPVMHFPEAPLQHTCELREPNKWDTRFIALAQHISTWSKDPSTQCGAVVIDDKNRVVSMGFNGYPRNIPDDSSLFEREVKYLKVLHAEVNAILFAQKDLTGCTMYVYPMPPCTRCASVIIQSGICRVVTVRPSSDAYERWGDQIHISEEMFEESKVQLEYMQ